MLYDNNHLIYDEKGNTVHFFHTNTDGLCMKAGAGVQTLLKEAYADFDLCRCGCALHIVCQSMDGDLLYLKYIDEKWHKYTLLISKTKGAYDKHFFLLPTGNCIQLFYTLRSCGKLLLVQQLLADGTVPQPAVIAPIHDCERPFFAVADKSLDTCIYYQNEQAVFGCKTYKWSSKSLGEFTPVFSTGGEAPYAALDSFGRQHICCVSGKEILYKQRTLDQTFSKTSRIPLPAHCGGVLPYLSFEEDKIYIIWKQERGVLYAGSQNDGETFCAPVRLLSSGADPVLFSLHKDNTRQSAIGYFLNGEIKFYNIAAPRMQPPVLKHTSPAQAVRPTAASDAAAELERVKKAVSTLGRELSELKNKVDLAISMINKNKTGA